jgi:hypothetical protein
MSIPAAANPPVHFVAFIVRTVPHPCETVMKLA